MQMVVAIVRPNKVEPVRSALAARGIVGLTVFEAKGHARQLGHAPEDRGPMIDAWFVPKMVMFICVADPQVPDVVEIVSAAAKTDTIGDGKIFTLPVEQCIRIRTGETGDAAI